jgi:fructose-1,6-bisphosphatase/inositol monophosphatase family enzyme
MRIDLDKVAAIMAEVADEVVLPRFRQLAAHEVRDKGVDDFVTVADEESEALLARRLPELLPGSWVLGEEMVSRAERSIDQLVDSTEPVWIVDPVDGTYNFTHGDPRFAVIVALCRGDETLAGWIHVPSEGETAMAERGGGAVQGGRRLQVAPPPEGPGAARGTLHAGFRGNPDLKRRVDRNRSRVRQIRSLRCSGLEYLRMAAGEADFSLFSGTKPWDHLAGALIHREAGGHTRLLDGQPYRPRDAVSVGLLSATDPASWTHLRSALFDGAWDDQPAATRSESPAIRR